MIAFIRLAAFAAFVTALLGSGPAAAADGHCAAATPDNSQRFFSKDAGSSADKARIAALAQRAVQERDTICVLALMDPTGAAYSKKLALGRVRWMAGNFAKEGIPANQIGYEMRPAESADDANMASVLVILGH